MPAPDGTVSIALDFDGSLAEPAPGGGLRWRHGARAFILGAAAAGMKLWLHSCRCTPACVLDLYDAPWDADEFWRTGRDPVLAAQSWDLYEEMRAFLEQEGVWPLLTPWTAPGKPIADLYPDDKGERPDWLVLAAELGIRLVHADARRDPAVGQPGGVVPPPVGGIAAAAGAAPGPAAPAAP